MKIYVVTAGEYSDYHIERIFLDKEKADNFCKYHSGDNIFWEDTMRVTEYETSDDIYQEPKESYEIITLKYAFIKKSLIPSLPIAIEKSFTLREPIRSTTFDRASWGELNLSHGYVLKITRSYKESEASEDDMIARTEKIAQDIIAAIKDLVYNDGFTFGQIASLYDLSESGKTKELIDNEEE